MARSDVRLRPTREADLDDVLRLERDPESCPFVGSWSRAEHLAAIAAQDHEHWIIEAGPDRRRAGFLLAIDLRSSGRGVHIKRIVVDEKGRGVGREAVSRFCRHAFEDLGASFVWLDVLAHNHRAQAAYRAAGLAVRQVPDEEVADWARPVGGFDDGSLIMVQERAISHRPSAIRKDRWRHRAIVIAALLLAAIVVNYAVAWWLAASYEPPIGPGWTRISRGTTPTPREQATWSAQRPPGVTGEPGMISVLSQRGVMLTMVLMRGGGGRAPQLGLSLRTGWPLPCVRGTAWHPPPAPVEQITVQDGMLLVPHGTGTARRTLYLPLVPVAGPLAVNTLPWLALLVGFWWTRRIARRARGRCVGCGYPVRPSGSTRCPECGLVDGRAAA